MERLEIGLNKDMVYSAGLQCEGPVKEPPNQPQRPPVKEPEDLPEPPPPPGEPPIEEPPNVPEESPVKEPPPKDPERKPPMWACHPVDGLMRGMAIYIH